MNILNKFKKEKKDKTQVDLDTEKQVKVDGVRVGSHYRLNQSASMVKYIWVTEKSVNLVNLGQYSFVVDKNLNKSEIKKAIGLIYGVKVVSVNIINIKGKSRRMGKSVGRTSSYKKAIATLKQGQKIDVIPT